MRRRIARISVLLATAVAMNVAAAWVCALVVDLGAAAMRELYTPLGAEHHWEVFRWDSGAGTRVLSCCWAGPAPALHNPGRPEALLPHWSVIDPPDPNAPRTVSRLEEAWGFPMRSLSGRFESSPTARGVSATRSGFLCLWRPEREGERGLCLPLRPIWTGFLIDTAACALLVLVAHAAVRDLGQIARRRIRVGVPV